MLSFLQEYGGTMVISFLLLAVVACIVWQLVRNRKQGKTSCGCDCSSCPSCGLCHDNKKPSK